MPYRHSAEYKELKPQSNYASAADAAVYDPRGWYSGSGSDFEIICGGRSAPSRPASSSPSAGLAQMKSKLAVLAKTQPPTDAGCLLPPTRPGGHCDDHHRSRGPPRRPPHRRPTAPTPARRHAPGIAFLAPFLILYLLFVIGPALYGLVMSFFDTSLVKPGLGSFAGFANYTEALQSSDFWHRCGTRSCSRILTTPPLVILAFVFALLAERASRGRWFFRLAFFAPYILPSAVVALIWIWLYTPALGLASAAVERRWASPRRAGWVIPAGR